MSHTDADASPALPPPPPPPARPRNRSTGAIVRRFTHCIFTHPRQPSTRWYLTFLHEGTYSEVYVGHPLAGDAPPVAIKVGKEPGAGGTSEEELRRMLHDEGKILQQLQSSRSVCRLHHQPSSHDEPVEYTDVDERKAPQPPFIAMTLLLCDVSQLRKEGRLTRPAMWEVFVLMLRAMRGVHEGRILHRDVKPSNFGLAHTAWSSAAPSSSAASPPHPPDTSPTTAAASPPLSAYIIDFGQSTQAFIPPSSSSSELSADKPHCPTSFKGKSLFASIARHEARQQGRSDDLIMLLYIALDFLLPPPGLPWKSVHDKRSDMGADRGRDSILKLKLEWRERWKKGERLSGSGSGETGDGSGNGGVRAGEDVLVRLLERLEGVDCKEEPPYDEVERELQRGWDEEARQAGDVGRTLSECVAEYLEANEELRRKLNDKPPTEEERARDKEERAERERKRRERRSERTNGDGRHSVDLTIDTQRTNGQQHPLPPTASPPTSSNQPHSGWAAHSPSDSSPNPTARNRSWPLQSLCECSSAVKAVLEFYGIAESPRANKAVNALLLTCALAELQCASMQQRTSAWLASHPTVSVPTSTFLPSPPPSSPLFALFPVACEFDTFVLLCTDACQRLRGSAGGADKVVERVLEEWTALEGEKLQLRAEQLMRDREGLDLTTLLPPPASTLGGRAARAAPAPASITPAAKPAVPAVAAAPVGQAAAKTLVDGWATQLPNRTIQPPTRQPIRRPINSLSAAKPPSATPLKQPAPFVSSAAPTAPSAAFAPNTLVPLGKAAAARREQMKLEARADVSVQAAATDKPAEGSAAPPSPVSTAAADDVVGAATISAADASTVAAPPDATTDTAATPPVRSKQLRVPRVSPLVQAKLDDLMKKRTAPARPAAEGEVKEEAQANELTDGDDDVVVVKPTEAAKGRRKARKATAQAEENKAEEAEEEDVIPLTQFMNGKAAGKTTDKAKAEVKPKAEQKRARRQTKRKKEAEEAEESTEDESSAESSDSEESEEEHAVDENEPVTARNDEGIFEVVSEVDYAEPLEDSVHRSFVGQQHKAEKLIRQNAMARYYRRAPYRIREKVEAMYQADGKWYPAVIIAVDRTHDMMRISRAALEKSNTLDEEACGEYPITGVPFHFKDYRGKEEAQLKDNQQWCYQILWAAGGDMLWYVEECLRRKHGAQPASMRGADKDASGAAQRVAGKKRGRRESDAAEEEPSKRQTVDAIEQLLADTPAEEKEAEQASVQPQAVDEAPVVYSKQLEHEAARKAEVNGTKATEAGKGKAADAAASKGDKQATGKARAANSAKEQSAANKQQTRAGGRSSMHKPTVDTEEADVSRTNSKAPSTAATPTEPRASHKADDTSTSAASPAKPASAESAATPGEEAPATPTGSAKSSPTTPVRHIPKKHTGRPLQRAAATSPAAKTEAQREVKAEPSQSTAAASASTANTSEKAQTQAAAAVPSAANDAEQEDVQAAMSDEATMGAAADQSAVADVERKDEASAAVAIEEKSAGVKPEKPSTPPTPSKRSAREHGTRRATLPSAPPSSLASLPSPPTSFAIASLTVSVPPLVQSSSPSPPAPPSPPPKTLRQRSRLSEGERLQLESAYSLSTKLQGASTPGSGSDSPSASLDWSTAGGRSTRVKAGKGSGTPVGSPVEEAAKTQPAAVGRKRGRGSAGPAVSSAGAPSDGEDSVGSEADASRREKRRRASTNA